MPSTIMCRMPIATIAIPLHLIIVPILDVQGRIGELR
jgi:hypothetical protein